MRQHFTKTARAAFFNQEGNPLSNQQIDEFVTTAYKNIGVVFTGEGLRQEADGWYIGVDDHDPSKFRWFFAYKNTPYGKKLFAMGHDGSSEAKKELLTFKREIFTDPNEHLYSEASGRVQQLYESWGIPKVPFQKAQKALSGKQLKQVDDYSYVRQLTGGGEYQKTMFGFPKVSAGPSYKQLWDLHNDVKDFRFPDLGNDPSGVKSYAWQQRILRQLEKGLRQKFGKTKSIALNKASNFLDMAEQAAREDSREYEGSGAYRRAFSYQDVALTFFHTVLTDLTGKTGAEVNKQPAKLDLGDYWLKYERHPKATWPVESNAWLVLPKDAQQNIQDPWKQYQEDLRVKLGEFSVDFYPDLKFPSIHNIYLEPALQRKGLGRRIIKALAQFYGGLYSDPQGNTNDRARRMWEGIPGVERVPSARNTKGFMYGLKQSRLLQPRICKGAAKQRFYHGTNATEATQILEKGFEPGVYLSESLQAAQWHADRHAKETGELPVVLEVILPEKMRKALQLDPLERRFGDSFFFQPSEGPIPPEYVSIHGQF